MLGRLPGNGVEMSKTGKLGSLFSGSGTAEFAGILSGMRPVWMAEIEKFPCAVLTKRFPHTTQLGDVTKINGAEIEPVDVVVFGSPCQNLSNAGNRGGLKHELLGDDESNDSGLFLEAMRIIQEMRESTNGKYPRFVIWENVKGAFTSNKGFDFRAVLSSFAGCELPMPKGNKWADNGLAELQDGSIAWRTLDSKYWGVPQRRKRIFIVRDYRGQCAGEICFKPESVFRDITQSRKERQGTPTNTQGSVRDASGFGETGIGYWQEGIQTLRANGGDRPGSPTNVVAYPESQQVGPLLARADSSPCVDRGQPFVVTAGFMAGPVEKVRSIGYQEEVSPTLKAESGGNTVPCVVFGQCDYTNYQQLDTTATIKSSGGNCGHGSEGLVLHPLRIDKTVRRLTPTECAKLMGFPDWWTQDVSHSDTQEYKMWGNGIVLPCLHYFVENIMQVLEDDGYARDNDSMRLLNIPEGV